MSDMSKPKRSKAATAAIIIGIVVAASIAAYIVLVMGYASLNIITTTQIPSKPAPAVPSTYVTVSGSVKTSGFQTHPVGLQFFDESSGISRFEQVVGSSYQVDLPNGERNWRVAVSWEGIGGATGFCDVGFINYQNTMDRYMTRNFEC